MSAAKSRGTRFESAVVNALTAFFAGRHGLAPRRVAQEGFADSGDIHGVSPFTVQCKDWKAWQDAIREGLDGAEKQKVHAKESYGVAFVKRVRKPVGAGYAVMTVATWARLLVRLRRAEALLREHAPGAYDRHVAETDDDAAGTFPA